MLRRILRLPLVLYRRLKFYYWQVVNHALFIRHNVKIGIKCKTAGVIFIRNAGSINIGSMFSANSGKGNNPIGGDTILRMICQKGASIIIGNNCAISNSTLWANKGITIEDNVIIGGGCRIWDSDFHPLDDKERQEHSSKIISKPILIRKNCFIGGSCIILKGVIIGEKSIIGAGSVVTKSVPDGEIWAGNPARFFKNV